MNEIAWLHSHVERCLEDHWGVHPLVVDEDGDYPFRWGTARCYVSIATGEPHLIRVWAFAASVPKKSLKLLSEINEINECARTVHVYWSGELVLAEQTLYADGLTSETLGLACLAVGVAADEIGVLLAAMFDGETPYPAVDTGDQEEETDELDGSDTTAE
jgi:Putative bacterial sensory transduction regulator